MDVRTQVSQLSDEARAALARRIKSRPSQPDGPAAEHDVAIVGGGAAALTLALRFDSPGRAPGSRVIEPKTHPVPEITHTVGSRPWRCRRTTCAIALASATT